MRLLGLNVLAAIAALAAAPVSAAPTHTVHANSFHGAEVHATSTRGMFVGVVRGDLSGQWGASVTHTKLSPDATITGGGFSIATSIDSRPTLVLGDFTGGTVTVVDPGDGCTNQRYALDATLGYVGAWLERDGSGTFSGTLVHYRRNVLGYCLTYGATVSGSITLSF